ncbi:MAG: geranylgeranyl reductase family protein [Candidatus Thorarchaeota archaeon]|nr:geranylgeranyl reductase family protein [Candidatus Thorarchaeota archaeon]
MTLKRPDVIVVGAGTAGCVTAKRCAELGLKTMLLDRRPESEIGKKVCGDEISKSHFEFTGIEPPSGDEISYEVKGADVYPPNMSNELQVRGWDDFDGWTIDRQLFGQRLLQRAVQMGVVFKPEVHVVGPIHLQERVAGVVYLDRHTDEKMAISCKLVVDASGFAGAIRKKLDDPLVERDIAKEDVALCYREILELKNPMAEPKVARVYLGGDAAPQGYAWVFPKGPKTVNAGVGITGGKGKAAPKSYFETFKKQNPLLHGARVLEGGGGAVPIRRPMKSLVTDGIAFVGDAAWQVNPIHGGGIGAGMRAGIILGEVAKQAIARRDLSARGLWGYNTLYLRGFGRRLASLEVFKRLLQAVSDDDMNYGFEKRLLEATDLMAANRGDGLSLGMRNKIGRVKRGASRVKLLVKLQKAAGLMKKVDRHYAKYPGTPDGLENWAREINKIMESAKFTPKGQPS